jgi:hypothetical protein
VGNARANRDVPIGDLVVTTCIAAITAERFIVTASDTKMAIEGDFSVEGVIKLEEFHGEWAALIAGGDVSQALFVLARATRILKGKTNDVLIVQDGFKRAYQEQLRECITDEFLSPFDMTLDGFKKRGSKQLPPTVYESLAFGIKNAKLGCKFLVYGFDDNELPHIFEVGRNGRVDSRDKPGFWAIGNGAFTAISMLTYLKQMAEATTMRTTVYNVLAAKYLSESASDVGEDTFWFVKRYGCNAFFRKPNLEKDLRRIWNEKGRPSIPEEALQAIDQADIHFPSVFKAQGIKPSDAQK